MKAFYCVDYLSHHWDPEDIACSYREIRKKLLENSHKAFLNDSYEDVRWRGRRRGSLRNKEQHDAHTEEYRLKRLENALWRSMARVCLPNLSKDSQLLDPEKINWQKTTDITWLYGPFHQSSPKDANHPSSFSSLNNSPATSPCCEYSAPPFLKPALKKREPPRDFDELESSLGIDPVVISKAIQNTEPITYHGRRRKTWPNTSFDKKSLRFNPNVMRVEYVPSSPVVRLVAANKDSRGQPQEKGHRQKQGISSPQKSTKLTTGSLRTTQSASWMPPSPPPSPPSSARSSPRSSPSSSPPSSPLSSPLPSPPLDVEIIEYDDYFFKPKGKSRVEDEGPSVFTLTTQVASNVKDIAVLCGTIAVYKGISLTVLPIAWMADRIIGKD